MKKRGKLEELDNTDEPIREILGRVPSWIVQWGNTLILIFFVSIIIISFIIKYPEVTYTNAKIVSINAPKAVVSRISGKLVKINFNEDATVRKGDLIGFVESVANHEQVLALYNELKVMNNYFVNNNQNDLDTRLFEIAHNELGELQQSFQAFFQAYLTYKNYIPGALYEEKKKMLLADLNNLSKTKDNLEKQKALIMQDASLSKSTFEANESLKQKKIISDLEYRTEKSKLINKLISIPQIDASILNTESIKSDKKKEILELENNIFRQRLHFKEELSIFNSQVEDWIKKYVLIAPISGTVNYNNFLQVNQQIQTNQILCYINPQDSKFYAEMYIPQSNFGKVKLGQKVLFKFPSYPYQEYGIVEGSIDFISKIGTDSGYLSKVKFNNKLSTTYNKDLHYKDGMVANTEIVTKDMRLIERFYYKIIKLVK